VDLHHLLLAGLPAHFESSVPGTQCSYERYVKIPQLAREKSLIGTCSEKA
jgi:hypothetical protein